MTLPLVALSIPPNILRQVDLPEPDAPTIVTSSPSSILKDTSSSAVVDTSPTLYTLLIFLNSFVSSEDGCSSLSSGYCSSYTPTEADGDKRCIENSKNECQLLE